MVCVSIQDYALVLSDLVVELNLVGLFPSSINSKNVKLNLNSNSKYLQGMIKQINKQTNNSTGSLQTILLHMNSTGFGFDLVGLICCTQSSYLLL